MYTNSKYGFSPEFPETWGNVVETIENEGSLITSVVLTSATDSDRSIKINIVDSENANEPAVIDYPQHDIITDSEEWNYYYYSNPLKDMPDYEDEKYLLI